MADVGSMFRGEEVIQVVVQTVFDDEGMKKGTRKVVTTAQDMGKGVQRVTKQLASNGAIISRTFQKQRQEFSAWALSFIFAGMQIQRTAQSIAATSVDTYLKMTRGQTEASQALIGLQANFKFLQFQMPRIKPKYQIWNWESTLGTFTKDPTKNFQVPKIY